MDDLVSVIIPAYNHEKYVKECIESVLNQTYTNLEILVEDDCSTDKTQEVIKGIKDERLKKIYSKKNKGTVNTINELIKMCKGKYIATLGSDDVWYPTKIEEQMKVFKENPNLGAVFTLVDFIDENGKKFEGNDPILYVFKKDNVSQGKRFRMFYKGGNHLCHSSAIVTRKVVKDIGLYNKAFRQLHDYEYWIRVLHKYDFYVLDKKLVKYRRANKDNNSISATSKENDIRMFNELFYINSKMIENMKSEIFIDGFQDLFRNKESKSKDELLCEKYFLLLNMSYGCTNRNYAYSLLIDNDNNGHLFDVLEKKFNYTLNDFYKDTGVSSDLYPETIVYEKFKISLEEKNAIINNLNLELSTITNSKSWKITKPIRAIRKMRK